MADHTPIEWTDATWNPITGCSVVSPGCTNCYAMKLAGTRMKNHPSRAGLTKDSKAGPVWTGEVRFNEQWLRQPLQWTKPRMIFVCAHGDLFAEGVPDEWIDKVFAIMTLAPQHTFQVLTKRAERMREYLMAADLLDRLTMTAWKTDQEEGASWAADIHSGHCNGLPLSNVWLGVSVEDQPRADQRIPALLDTPAALRWISAEPVLGYLDIEQYLRVIIRKPQSVGKSTNINFEIVRHALDWVVVGGESGPGARPMHPDWARSLRDQCAAAGVPFLFKQWGAWGKATPAPAGTAGDYALAPSVPESRGYGKSVFPIDAFPLQIEGLISPPAVLQRIGKKAAGRHLDGVLHDGFPERRA
ncbi:phage Gp37/Gp68 family protein [Rhizobium sp. FKY42]|uniref:phage Gp37/Gp68 family protein n=1 Tax=Rhizobium sp. FKY42 TaxID=2562310 RepID=UPI0010C0C6FB|nr:phage Gp37/Gp68 family protein [Rhizobium sp. FKY42]